MWREKKKEFVFDPPYHGDAGFGLNNHKTFINPILFLEKFDSNIPTFQQSTRSTNTIEVFKNLFEMDDYELLSRMHEDKIMKTLKFIKNNLEKNNLFCLATFSTVGERNFENIQQRREIKFGRVFIFVIENVQETSNENDKKAINSLFAGIVPVEFSQKNLTILINYEEIYKASIDETANFFKFDLMQQNTTPIPMFIVIDYNYYKHNLNFAINTLLENFYQHPTSPDYGCESLRKLLESVCFKTIKFSNQGPFHQWKHEITKYMEDLVKLKRQLRIIFCHSNARNEHIDSMFHCFELIQKLIKKDYIPNQKSWSLVQYINLHGQKEYVELVKKKYAKKWEKQLVIASSDCIAPLINFCKDEEEYYSRRKNITLKNCVWLYNGHDYPNMPYLFIQNEKFAIGICEEIKENSWACKHLNEVEKIQHFCVKCKENIEIKNDSFTCDCGVILNFKKQFVLPGI